VKLIGAIVLMLVLFLSVGSARANAHCQRRYRDLALPVYDRLVMVSHWRNFTCSRASRVANAVADAYERGLPLVDYPPPPNGVPGGGGQTFQIRTFSYGTYTCRMTARGSDFVAGRCRQGARFVSFTDMNHWFVHDQ
jgi:hypothetical protein